MPNSNIQIKAHHQRAIDNLTNEYNNNPDYLGLIIGGSVAKGLARDDSDIDFMIIASEKEYKRRSKEDNFFINRTDLCDYEGGFVDGKVINLEYLHQVEKKGNEPSRAAFDGAFVAFSKVVGLYEIIDQIQAYPKKGREDRMKAFYSMAFIQNWLMGEATRHQNLYTQTRAASQLALFSGRLILAHNCILFPYHKWFIQYLNRCKEKPDGFIENIHSLLKEPNSSNAARLFESLRDFNDWGVTDLQAFEWFLDEVELSWMNDSTPLEDL
ncbi:MAG: nucleotidyltransferase domain-containing protein [Balneola sp.]